MKLTRWDDLNHRATSKTLDQERAAAKEELDSVGLADLRKAQQQTQVEVAQTLGLPQASISDMEKRSDLLLSTLAKYIHALGGELQITAVFPRAKFNLAPPASVTRQSSRTGLEPVPSSSALVNQSSRQVRPVAVTVHSSKERKQIKARA